MNPFKFILRIIICFLALCTYLGSTHGQTISVKTTTKRIVLGKCTSTEITKTYHDTVPADTAAILRKHFPVVDTAAILKRLCKSIPPVDSVVPPVQVDAVTLFGIYTHPDYLIIGDQASENQTLAWAKREGANMLNLYARASLYTASSREKLAAFVKKAKEQYGIILVTVDVRLTDSRELPGWIAYFQKYAGTVSMIEPLAEFEPYTQKYKTVNGVKVVDCQYDNVCLSSYEAKYAHFFYMVNTMDSLCKKYGSKQNWYEGWIGNNYSNPQAAVDSMVKHCDRIFVSNYVKQSDYYSMNPSLGPWDNRMDKRLDLIANSISRIRPDKPMEIAEITSLELAKWGADGGDFLGLVYACPMNTENQCHSFFGTRWELAITEYKKSSTLILQHTKLVGRTIFYQKYGLLAHPY